MDLLRLSMLVSALLVPATMAQKAYDWDYPDGLGVRYLLYRNLQPAKLVPRKDGLHARAVYVPKDKRGWVRYKGTTWGWGMAVYEFPKDSSSLRPVKNLHPARNFEEYVLAGDPSRSLLRYVAVEGEERSGEKGNYKLWEYFDVFPGVAGDDPGYRPAQGGMYWGYDLDLGIKHFVAKGMYRWEEDRKAPSYRRSRYLLITKERIKLKGPPLPVSWAFEVLHFPKGGGKHFAEVARAAERGVKKVFRVEGEERKLGKSKLRWWRWFADRTPSQGTRKATVHHHVFAAAYSTEKGQIVLKVEFPANDDRLDPKWEALGKKVLGSLRILDQDEREKALKKPLRGFVSYKVAASHSLGEREVVMVVRHPLVKGHKPTRRQLDRARKMVASIEPTKR